MAGPIRGQLEEVPKFLKLDLTLIRPRSILSVTLG